MDFHLKKRGWILAFCIFSSAIFLSLLIWRPDFIEERIEALTFDYRFHIRNFISKPELSGKVLIVAVDEKSLTEYGRWPWSRKLLAELVNAIMALQPKVLAVDMFFPESETIKADKALGEAFRKAGNRIIVGSGFAVPVKGKKKDIKIIENIPDEIIDSAFPWIKEQESLKKFRFVADYLYQTAPHILQGSFVGHVYSHTDYDGKTRWENLYVKYGDEFFPSLSLQTARLMLDLSMNEMAIVGGKGIQLGEQCFIPSDQNGRMLVNYLGKEGTIDYISASDVFNKRKQAEKIKDRIVFLGTSALATHDTKHSPFSANLPGVEKNATVVDNILTGNFLKKSIGYIEIVIICITGLALGLFLPRLKALTGAALSFALISGYIIATVLLFTYAGLWINLIYPAANMMLIAVVVTVTKYFLEEKKAKEIRSMFSSYVSPKIVSELINNPEKAKLGGERKVVTILFSDVIGFTALSERKPPEEVIDLLNEYFNEMTDIIFRWDGTLDKFVGDEIMAFWGAPTDQSNHAELAVRCALNMIDRLSAMQEKWQREGKEVLDCGIGINTGEVVIGNIGAMGKKMDYTVMGDHVNLAARVEKLTREYNAKIIITEFTMDHIYPLVESGSIGHCQLKEQETVRVKGKEKEVKIFELKGLKHIEFSSASHRRPP